MRIFGFDNRWRGGGGLFQCLEGSRIFPRTEVVGGGGGLYF